MVPAARRASMKVDHDHIFKQLVEAFFQEFMQLFCSAVAAQIDFRKVEFLREELFTDVRGGRRKRLDCACIEKVGRRGAAPGVDDETWRDYAVDLERQIDDLHGRIHRGAYRAKPSK